MNTPPLKATKRSFCKERQADLLGSLAPHCSPDDLGRQKRGECAPARLRAVVRAFVGVTPRRHGLRSLTALHEELTVRECGDGSNEGEVGRSDASRSKTRSTR